MKTSLAIKKAAAGGGAVRGCSGEKTLPLWTVTGRKRQRREKAQRVQLKIEKILLERMGRFGGRDSETIDSKNDAVRSGGI